MFLIPAIRYIAETASLIMLPRMQGDGAGGLGSQPSRESVRESEQCATLAVDAGPLPVAWFSYLVRRIHSRPKLICPLG